VLAAILPLYRSSDDKLCRARLNQWAVQLGQAVVYMTEQINKDDKLLPNTTLGFVLLNDCQRDVMAAARSTQILPVSTCVREHCTSPHNISISDIGK